MIPIRIKNEKQQQVYQNLIWGFIIGVCVGLLWVHSIKQDLIEENERLKLQNQQMISTLIKVQDYLEGVNDELAKTNDERTIETRKENAGEKQED